MLSPDRQRKRNWVRIQRAMASREGIPLVRRPGAGLTWTVLHFRSPLGDPRYGDRPTKARHRGESFRNRIAINGGPENWARGRVHRRERAWESFKKAKLFRRPATFLRYHLLAPPNPRWNRETSTTAGSLIRPVFVQVALACESVAYFFLY